MTLNVKALEEVALWLENDAPHVGIEGAPVTRKGVGGFQMRYWVVQSDNPECGTTCCIGGAVWLFNELKYHCVDTVENETAEFLGISPRCGDALFYARGTSVSLAEITPAWAARCIRNLIKTGCVDWEGTK